VVNPINPHITYRFDILSHVKAQLLDLQFEVQRQWQRLLRLSTVPYSIFCLSARAGVAQICG
jgi:hypothetical protein